MRKDNFWMETGSRGRRMVFSAGHYTHEKPMELSVFVRDGDRPVRALTIRCTSDGLWNRLHVYASDLGVLLDRQWRR